MPAKPSLSLQFLLGLFFTALAIQLIYLIVFLVAFLRKRTEKNNPPEPVSVIVCAHDEELNLKELIPALLSQNYGEFEVIVVNDRSNDSTYDYLLEETKKHRNLRMVNVAQTPNHVNGKKYAITLGIRAATHNWILLTDADCRPRNENWISNMSKQFDAETQFVLGYSPYEKKPGFLNKFIRFESIITAIQYFAFALLKNPYMGVGRNLAYPKSLFLEKKGFNNYLYVTGGDDDLFVNQHATNKNTTVQFVADAQTYSIPEETVKAFFNQKLRHLSVGKRYKFKHRFLLGIFALTWIITWFTGIPTLVFNYENYFVSGLFALRLILLVILVRTLLKQTATVFELWLLPILDFLYSIYYLSTGLVALLTKKIRWKN